MDFSNFPYHHHSMSNRQKHLSWKRNFRIIATCGLLSNRVIAFFIKTMRYRDLIQPTEMDIPRKITR